MELIMKNDWHGTTAKITAVSTSVHEITNKAVVKWEDWCSANSILCPKKTCYCSQAITALDENGCFYFLVTE